jgi:CheY-like chemotaxis protein
MDRRTWIIKKIQQILLKDIYIYLFVLLICFELGLLGLLFVQEESLKKNILMIYSYIHILLQYFNFILYKKMKNNHFKINQEEQFLGKRIINQIQTGILMIEKDSFQIKYANEQINHIFNISTDSSFNDLKARLSLFFKHHSFEDVSFNFCFDSYEGENLFDHIKKCSRENLYTRFSNKDIIIGIKIKIIDEFYVCIIENISDERKEIYNNIMRNIKSQFLLTTSHELNNPLNSLMHSAHQLTKEKDPKNYAKLIKRMKMSKCLIKTFIKNLIFYFKLYFNEKMPTQPSSINLEFMMKSVGEKFIDLFKYKKLKIEYEFKELRNIFISNDYSFMKCLLKNIFLFLYYSIKKGGNLKVSSVVEDEKNILLLLNYKIDNLLLEVSSSGYASNSFIEKTSKETFIENSVQTNQMIKDMIEKQLKILGLTNCFKLLQHGKNCYISLRLKYTEIIVSEDANLIEFSESDSKCKNILEHSNKEFSINSSSRNSFKIIKDNPYPLSQTDLTQKLKNIANNYSITPPKRTQAFLSSNELTRLKEFSISRISIDGNEINPKTYFQEKMREFKNESEESSPNLLILSQNSTFNISRVPSRKQTRNKTKRKTTKKLFSPLLLNKNLQQINDSETESLKRIQEDNISFNTSNRNFDHNTENTLTFPNNISEENSPPYKIKRLSKFLIKNSSEIKEENVLETAEPGKCISKIVTQIINESDTTLGKGSLSEIKEEIKDISANEDQFLRKLTTSCNCSDVLVVDDETFNLNTMKFLFKTNNIIIDTAVDGLDCLKKIQEKIQKKCTYCIKSYKLIIMDVMMPNMDGIEASKQIHDLIKSGGMCSETKIIIVSAHEQDQILDRVKGISVIKEFVSKPIKKAKIEQILNMYYY